MGNIFAKKTKLKFTDFLIKPRNFDFLHICTASGTEILRVEAYHVMHVVVEHTAGRWMSMDVH